MGPACPAPAGARAGSPTRTATVLSPAAGACSNAATPPAPATRLVPFGDATVRAPAPNCDQRASSVVVASASSNAGAATTVPTDAQRGFAFAPAARAGCRRPRPGIGTAHA